MSSVSRPQLLLGTTAWMESPATSNDGRRLTAVKTPHGPVVYLQALAEHTRPTVALIFQVQPHEASRPEPALGILRLGRVDKTIHVGEPGGAGKVAGLSRPRSTLAWLLPLDT